MADIIRHFYLRFKINKSVNYLDICILFEQSSDSSTDN